MAGKSIGLRAFLFEFRGDWSFFKSVFSFPGWRENGGCCWRCPAQPEDIRKASSSAAWRRSRYDHFGLLAYLRGYRGHVSPLFAVPFLMAICFKIDWLHCCDLGVAADFLGNVLYAVLQRMPGSSIIQQCSALFLEILAWYKANNVQDRFQNITHLMIRKAANKPPKLRGKAAEIRGLVPFALYASEKWLDDGSLESQAITIAAQSLVVCYANLNPDEFQPARIREACRTFCLQYSALEQFHGEDSCLWRIKPKFHLFQEICEMSRNCPSGSWTYRDEDFGGTAARYVCSRGGPVAPHRAAQSLIDRFTATHCDIELLE